MLPVAHPCHRLATPAVDAAAAGQLYAEALAALPSRNAGPPVQGQPESRTIPQPSPSLGGLDAVLRDGSFGRKHSSTLAASWQAGATAHDGEPLPESWPPAPVEGVKHAPLPFSVNSSDLPKLPSMERGSRKASGPGNHQALPPLQRRRRLGCPGPVAEAVSLSAAAGSRSQDKAEAGSPVPFRSSCSQPRLPAWTGKAPAALEGCSQGGAASQASSTQRVIRHRAELIQVSLGAGPK